MYIHDLTGQQLRSWNHGDEDRRGCLGRFLTVIADTTNQRFTIYTLTGERIRDVPCDLIRDGDITICHVGDNSVLVANCDGKPALYRVNLTTGDVVWRSDRVDSPVGILMHSKDLALVTSNNFSNQVKIWTLNAGTGK